LYEIYLKDVKSALRVTYMENENKATPDIVLDLPSFQLIRAGQPVKLEKTPMELLTLLARKRGTLVTRDEIIAAIWGDAVHVDVVASINTAIHKIRQALDDDSASPRYLETVVGKGYRLTGPVRVIDNNGAPFETASPSQRRTSRWVWVASVVAVLVAALIVVKLAMRRAATVVSGDQRTRVILGIVPLHNLSEDSGQDYFVEGLTDEILTQLGQLNPERLTVMRYGSPRSARSADPTSIDPRKPSELQYVLEGSVRRQHEQARISVRLERAGDGTTLWTESFDRHVGDLLSLQSEIAQRIGRALQIQVLGRANNKRFAPDVIEAYLRGRFEMSRGDVQEAARTSFERAIALDPTYASAHAGLADFYSSRAVSNDEGAAEAWRLAELHATQALSLDSENVEAQTAIAEIKLMHDWDWHAAREHALHALQLNPSSPEAHSVYARYLTVAGSVAEAVNQRKQAVALDPLRVDRCAPCSEVCTSANPDCCRSVLTPILIRSVAIRATLNSCARLASRQSKSCQAHCRDSVIVGIRSPNKAVWIRELATSHVQKHACRAGLHLQWRSLIGTGLESRMCCMAYCTATDGLQGFSTE
jgi:TolB-like protein/DNA-binding winged helix-turn-helix (wHTH) protein